MTRRPPRARGWHPALGKPPPVDPCWRLRGAWDPVTGQPARLRRPRGVSAALPTPAAASRAERLARPHACPRGPRGLGHTPLTWARPGAQAPSVEPASGRSARAPAGSDSSGAPAAQSCRRRHRPGLPQTAGERLRGAPAQPWRERRLPGAGHIPRPQERLPRAPAARRPPPARRGKPGASSPAPRPRLSPPPPPRRGTEFALRPAAPLVEAAARPLPRPQSPGCS